MGAPKARGVVTAHSARYHKDREIKPCRYIGPKGGKGLMVAQYKAHQCNTSNDTND